MTPSSEQTVSTLYANWIHSTAMGVPFNRWAPPTAITILLVLAACVPPGTTASTVTVTKPAYSPPAAASVAVAPTETTIPGDGSYRVGVEVTPGTYSSKPNRDSIPLCQWTRLCDLS
jgi:hypothetical protein